MYANLTKKPIKDILKKLRSKFKTYREAYTTTISLFTKMEYENNAVVQKLDTYYKSINSSAKVKSKIDALITLHEQPGILDDLLLYERPDVEAVNNLINSDPLITYHDFMYRTSEILHYYHIAFL